ncbi:molybdopterin cofactor-binding domain-containing protein [Aquabacter spiritensis]|uniref:CO/xanthine dehydrogenase Mo-binding subunit n=1 Tax=Aquabacter spiritensis TaxID=933073 RepID=A0A4V2UXK4_9HYPH|nr:molybdopterin cofactor-binding domain-containing protein [Aquabacter spiritensis]TCT03848.1 CO/xanthine dehydrogenase Mo-binding subunit [Aquabacter spiritensis]
MTDAPAAPPLPKSLAANPLLSQWVRIGAEGRIDILPGKVEIGQGIATALLKMAAEALEVDPARIRMVRPATGDSPDEGVTSGSQSIQDCGRALRHVCAEVRDLFRAEAALRLGADAGALGLEDGTFVGPGNARLSYWELEDAVSLERAATAGVRPVRRTGLDLARIDLADKVFGRPRFIHDMRPEGMLHGRVVLPPRTGSSPRRDQDLAALAGPGVQLVADGAFIGLLSDDERSVDQAAARLREKLGWEGGTPLPDEATLGDWLRAQPVAPVVEQRGGPAEPAVQTLARSFLKPFIAHGSMAPSCALALWSPDEAEILRVWTHSQGIYNLRADLSVVFGLPPERIRVEHVEGAGCYGHNPADDVALDAALLARAAPGRVVRAQMSRDEELGGGPFAPAMRVDVEADLDASGRLCGWRHTIWSNGHSMRPGRSKASTLRAAAHVSGGAPWPIAINMPASNGGGADRNSMPLYDIPAACVTNNRLTVMPIRTSAMRALGAFANVFAIESMMDEAALAVGEDAVAFRLRHLSDDRARAVILEAARLGRWREAPRADGEGQGFAFARYKNTGAYCAVVADVACTDEVRVNRLLVVVDVGEVISHDGVVNQVEGGAIQATSWALKEAVHFSPEGILSRSWEDYPILRFSEVPAVAVHVLDRPDAPPMGAGEASQGPTGAAIANAVHDALGMRMTRFPLTRDTLIEAMELGQ